MEITELLMVMAELLITALAIIVVFNLLAIWIVPKLKARATHELSRISQVLDNETLIALTVEVDGDQFLCYNARTQLFVCQGQDINEILEKFLQRFPNKGIAIYNGDESALTVLNQQLKEFNENIGGVRSPS